MGGKTLYPNPGVLRLEIRLWGVARQQTEEVKRALEACLASQGVADATLSQPDPDTVVAQSPAISAATPDTEFPAFDSYLKALQRLDWRHLWCQLRLSVTDPEKQAAVRGNTLVLAGILNGGESSLRVRAIYPTGPHGNEETTLFEYSGWPPERTFLSELDGVSYPPATALAAVEAARPPRTAGTPTGAGTEGTAALSETEERPEEQIPESIRSLFTPPLGSQIGNLILWFIAPKSGRFSAYLLRIVLAFCLAVSGAILIAAFRVSNPFLAWYILTPLVLLALLAGGFLSILVYQRIKMSYRMM